MLNEVKHLAFSWNLEEEILRLRLRMTSEGDVLRYPRLSAI